MDWKGLVLPGDYVSATTFPWQGPGRWRWRRFDVNGARPSLWEQRVPTEIQQEPSSTNCHLSIRVSRYARQSFLWDANAWALWFYTVFSMLTTVFSLTLEGMGTITKSLNVSLSLYTCINFFLQTFCINSRLSLLLDIQHVCPSSLVSLVIVSHPKTSDALKKPPYLQNTESVRTLKLTESRRRYGRVWEERRDEKGRESGKDGRRRKRWEAMGAERQGERYAVTKWKGG